MGVQRRLLVGVLTVGSLLCVYLYVNLEPLSLSRAHVQHYNGTDRVTLAASSGSRGPEEPLDRRCNSEQCTRPAPAATFHPELTTLHKHTRATRSPTLKAKTSKAAEHKRAENNVPDVSKSGSGSEGANKTRTSTKGPTLKRQQPTQAATSTEPPFIGDTYMSEDIPPQTDCTDTIRSRVTKTEFGGRFLQHIPVLQWAQHVTSEQHQRLSRYPGAHGWGGVDYKTLEETLSVLNSSANWQMLDDWKDRSNKSECIRCAVVGNGGILKDSQKGKEIDSHHYVFRTNGAIIKGFEKDVGSRTTHYTFSTNTLMNSMRSYAGSGYRGPPVSPETRYVFLPDHDRDYLLMKAAATHSPVQRGRERGKDPSKYFGEDVSAGKLKMYHPDFIRYLRNRFLRSKALKTKYKNIYRPSTGAVMLLAALHTCDKVSAYGFMTSDFKKYSDHYYDSKFHPVGFFINHDLRMEMMLWKQLHEAGLIRLTNGAIIKGFEKDVGSRTTHYTFSTNTLMNSMRSYAGSGYRGPPVSPETRYVFLPDHDRDYLLMKAAATHSPVQRGRERGKDPSKYFGEDVSAGKLKMYHPDFIRYLRNRFLRSKALKTKYKNIYRPSTGAVMLLAALHTCDKVSAYGFMTSDFKKYSDHYYDSKFHPVGFFINHDLRMEMMLWKQLHEAGLIRLYMHEQK